MKHINQKRACIFLKIDKLLAGDSTFCSAHVVQVIRRFETLISGFPRYWEGHDHVMDSLDEVTGLYFRRLHSVQRVAIGKLVLASSIHREVQESGVHSGRQRFAKASQRHWP